MVQSIEDARRRQASRSAGAGRVPPCNLQAEESLLGAMLLSKDAIVDAVQVCSADDFYKPAHGHVFEAVTSLYAQGEPVDPVTVADELSRAGLLDAIGGPATLISLQANTPATSNAARYARIVEEHALLRRLIGVANEIAELGYDVPDDVGAVVDRAESLVFEVAQRRIADTTKPLRELLSLSLDRLEALYDRGEAITGVPTGYLDLDHQLAGLQPSNLVIVGARPAMGKCVAATTRLVDPDTGALRTMAELHRRGVAGDQVAVLSLAQDRSLRVRRPSAFVDDGRRRVFRVRTRSGREVATTASHPFLTPAGWCPLADLAVGARVAVPRMLPVFGRDALPDAEIVLLARVLGSGRAVAPPRVAATDPGAVAQVREAAAATGFAVRPEPGGGVLRLVPVAPASPGLQRLRSAGLLGVPARELFVPDDVFRLPAGGLARFLQCLLATAAVVPAGTGERTLIWRTPARLLAHDVQHLLLRFGVNAGVRPAAVPAGGGARRPGSAVEVRGEDLERLAAEIGLPGEAGMGRDRLPVAAVASRRAGIPAVAPVGAAASGAGAAGGMGALVGDAVLWDEVVAIVDEGEQQVYDLTVPHEHNFVAADVFVHNTAFALGIAAHAAMEANVPVLFFSLEMSHLEITQRLLCAEARVDATRMRNGRLHESDWPKIQHAIGRLGEAPIFIDDNPMLTVMDIRAKARRLKSREGLGLVVVDYLQLMSGRQSSENRQVEVSEISRGLKILARELEVPVVALSQLSRNLEMRADKRPVLADLRESGSLEQDADVVMFLYRDEIYNSDSPDRGTAEVIVSKHRSGPTGVAHLAFLGQYTRFANMARV